MSTKIYNGYKVNSVNLQELFELSVKMRDKMRELADAEFKKLIIDTSIWALIDHQFTGKELKKTSPISKAHMQYMDISSKIRKTGQRNPAYDFDCSWAFVPVPFKDYTLALLYSERETYNKIWNSSDLISPYPYWNNSDPDPDVTDEEWKQREVDWETLGYEPPSCNGFSFEIYGKYNMPTFVKHSDIKQEYIDEIYDRNVAFDHIISDIICIEMVKEKEFELVDGFYSQREKYKELLSEDSEWKKFKTKTEKMVEKKLPECYTVEDLTKVYE